MPPALNISKSNAHKNLILYILDKKIYFKKFRKLFPKFGGSLNDFFEI